MAESFDLLLTGGTVVNQDGAGPRDIGVRGGRIAALGDACGGRGGRAHRLPRPPHPARCDRQPGAFPRARLRPTRRIWRRGSRAAVLGGVTAVFEMPNTDPLTTGAAALADKLVAGARPHALRFRLLGRRHPGKCRRRSASWSGCRARPASRSSWAPRPATCWSRTTTAWRRSWPTPAAARRSTPRTSSACASARRACRGRSRLASRSGATSRPRPALDRAARLARRAGARAIHVLHISTREEMRSLAADKDVASCEATPHHLTLSGRRLWAARHADPDEPAGARGAPSRCPLAGPGAGRRRRARLRPCAAYARGEGKPLSRHRRRA